MVNQMVDMNKLKNIMLYLIERVGKAPIGKTKLMKLLYYIDFDHMEEYGEPVTWATYRKLDHGPVPMEALALWDEMEANGSIKIKRRLVGPCHIEQRPIPNVMADISMLTDQERKHLEKVIAKWINATAKTIEDASHRETPWLCTRDHEIIEYETAFYRRIEIENQDRFADALLSHPPFIREMGSYISAQ